MRSERVSTPESETPTKIPLMIYAALVLPSALTVFAYLELMNRELGLPARLNAFIISLGTLAGVLHMLGVVPRQRHLCAFAGPTVALPVMASGIVSLITT